MRNTSYSNEIADMTKTLTCPDCGATVVWDETSSSWVCPECGFYAHEPERKRQDEHKTHLSE